MYHLKDQSFRLVHWLSINLLLRRTSQESINLERKYYLDCSSDTLCTRRELEWKGDMMVADIAELETMDASEIYSKRLNAKEVMFPKEGEFIFPVADRRIKLPGGDQDLRTSTLIRDRPIWGESHVEFSWRIRRASSTTSRLISGCRWSKKWFLFHVRKHHIPPSRWTQSQTLLAERRIIPYSTEVLRRFQNYTYEFGCKERETPRWLFSSQLDIDPEDKEFKETIKNARKKLETPVAPAMPCKISKNNKKCGNGESNKVQSKLACILKS